MLGGGGPRRLPCLCTVRGVRPMRTRCSPAHVRLRLRWRARRGLQTRPSCSRGWRRASWRARCAPARSLRGARAARRARHRPMQRLPAAWRARWMACGAWWRLRAGVLTRRTLLGPAPAWLPQVRSARCAHRSGNGGTGVPRVLNAAVIGRGGASPCSPPTASCLYVHEQPACMHAHRALQAVSWCRRSSGPRPRQCCMQQWAWARNGCRRQVGPCVQLSACVRACGPRGQAPCQASRPVRLPGVLLGRFSACLDASNTQPLHRLRHCRHRRAAGEAPCPKALAHLGQVCCAHTSALARQGLHSQAAEAAVHHVAMLTQVRPAGMAGWLRVRACVGMRLCARMCLA